MKFPYGICDFYDMITDNYFYVDRTDKISLIEKTGKYLLFLRPRRFGKSLVLSMLENYYDVAKAQQFEQLFGRLKIGKAPTPRHNQYFVMNWDFSAVDSTGSAEDVRLRLHNHINGCIEQFIVRYQDFLAHEIQIHPTNALRSLQSLLTAIESTPYKLYLLIDEYDHFANEVMMTKQSNSQEKPESLIEKVGALNGIFKAVKSATKGSGIARLFMTGVSPSLMTDLISSGFNIAENVYLTPQFNDLCGFWEADILAALQQIALECGFDEQQVNEALAMMRVFYNGYCFVYEEKSKLYNSSLALYFLKYLHENAQYPRQILDDNLTMDRNKIIYISQLPHGEDVISAVLNEEKPFAIAELSNRFGVNDILTATKDTPFMASLLYYFGVLTFDGYSTSGELILKIPNLVMRKLYVEQLQDLFLPDWTAKEQVRGIAQAFYQTGNLHPLCQFMTQNYFKAFNNRDYKGRQMN